MNAYLIAAKANAWELDQHVGRAIDANQPNYIIEALGHGVGCYHKDREKMLRPHKGLKSLFCMN